MFSRGRPWTVFLLFIVFAIYALNHGVYVGSATQGEGALAQKTCRYFYLSGIVELPAQAVKRGTDNLKNANATRCTFFAE